MVLIAVVLLASNAPAARPAPTLPAQIPAAERATARFEYSNQNPLGKVPRRDAPLTPALRQEDGVWKLTLPGCIFPAYRGRDVSFW